MSEEAPAAPATETVPAEPSTPTTPVTEATPAPAPEQPAQNAATDQATATSYFTPEQLKEMESFYKNNGGYDKVFGETKKIISRPQDYQKAPEQPAQPQQPVQTPQAPQNAPQAPKPGTYSLEELAAQQYFDRLASEEKYANIADEIREGKVLQGLKNFNINPITDGRVNDADIRKYLDLYAASKPATPTSVEPAASAVDYVATATEGKITSMEEANKIQMQSLQLQAAGQPPHPLEQAAKDFVKEYYSQKKK